MRFTLFLILASAAVVGCHRTKNPDTGDTVGGSSDTDSDGLVSDSDIDADGDADGDRTCPFECMTEFQCDNTGGEAVEGECDSVNQICCETGSGDGDTDGDSDGDTDGDADSDGDGDTDTEEPPGTECTEDEKRCADNILERCVNGWWVTWMDCGLMELGCSAEGDDGACVLGEIPDTGGDGGVGDDGGPETETGTATHVDISHCDENTCAHYPDDCIAHFEDGTLQGAREEDFGFFVTHDETGVMIPQVEFDYVGPAVMMGEEGCTPYAMCLRSVETFRGWGANAFVFWKEEVEPRDLSRYRGIGFWTLRRSDMNSLGVAFPTPYTHPGFGYCEEDKGDCYNDYSGYVIFEKKNVWEYKEVLFEDLTMSDNWGYQPPDGTPFPADQILGVKLNIDGNVPFDFCIDEIRLI